MRIATASTDAIVASVYSRRGRNRTTLEVSSGRAAFAPVVESGKVGDGDYATECRLCLPETSNGRGGDATQGQSSEVVQGDSRGSCTRLTGSLEKGVNRRVNGR